MGHWAELPRGGGLGKTNRTCRKRVLWQEEEDRQNHRGREAWVVPKAGGVPAPSSLDLPTAGRALGCLPRWREARSEGPEELRVGGKWGDGWNKKPKSWMSHRWSLSHNNKKELD